MNQSENGRNETEAHWKKKRKKGKKQNE